VSSIDDADAGVGFTVLGLDGETHDEAARAVMAHLGSTARTFINVGDTPEALRRIIADLAERHVEINDRVKFEFVLAPREPSGELAPLGRGTAASVRLTRRRSYKK